MHRKQGRHACALRFSRVLVACYNTRLIVFCANIITGTVYWQAEGKNGLLLMSAYCINTVSSPLFLSAILMAHLNKALNVSTVEV